MFFILFGYRAYLVEGRLDILCQEVGHLQSCTIHGQESLAGLLVAQLHTHIQPLDALHQEAKHCSGRGSSGGSKKSWGSDES